MHRANNLPPSCANCLEIWEPQSPGTLWACPGLYWGLLYFTFTPEGTQLPSSLFLKQKTNNRLFCRTMTVLVSAFLQIFFLEVLFNRLAVIDVLYSLSPTIHGDTIANCQSQMSAVATGHFPLTITNKQLVPVAFIHLFSTLKGTLSCHGICFNSQKT